MVLRSPEDITINGLTLSTLFNYGGGYFVVNEVTGRDIAPRTLEMAKALGQNGTHILGSTLDPRTLKVRYTLKGNSYNDLRVRMEILNDLLYENDNMELRFADEPNRFYFATLSGHTEIQEKSMLHQGTIEFLRSDPYKYGVEITQDFVNGAAAVDKAGNYETFPKFTFNVLQDITFLDLITEGAYMRIGQPYSVTAPTPVEPESIVLHDDLATTLGWANSTTVEQGTVSGSITSNGYAFAPSNFGYGTSWHGPTVQKSIPGAPYDEFVVEVALVLSNPSNKSVGRVLVELLDQNNAVIARMSIHKQTEGTEGNEGTVMVGNSADNYKLFQTKGSKGNEYKNFDGILRIAKRNNVWTAYIAQVDKTTKVHTARYHGSYTDMNAKYDRQLAQIRLHFGAYGTRTAAPMYFHDVKVWRVNDIQQEIENNATEVMARAGDTIEIDHQKDIILINGEPRIDLKDFGATYFPLQGNAQVVFVEPSESVEGYLSFRERFL